MAEIKYDELREIIGDKEVICPFNDILYTDIVDMGHKEHDAYVQMVKEKAGDKEVLIIAAMKAEDDCVDIHYVVKSNKKFERIRRITGYLTGTIDRWGNAKRAELRDRVKHA